MPRGTTVHTIKDRGGVYDIKVQCIEGDEHKLAIIDVECGCGDDDHHLIIGHEQNPTGDPDVDVLEIGSVLANVRQWRELFLPLLDPPKT